MQWCKKLLVVIAMVFVPLQAGAAAVAELFCHEPPSASHALADDAGPSHTHASDSESAGHAHPHHGTPQTDGDPLGHACCHHGIFSLPSLIAAVFAPAPSVWFVQSPPPLDPFFPEQPHRPPLA